MEDTEFNLEEELNALEQLALANTPGANSKIGLTKTIGVLADEWFELKGKLEAIKVEGNKYTARQDEIETTLKKLMKDNDIAKITSTLGSISRSVKCMPSVKDLPAFIKWVAEDMDNRIGFLEKKVNPAAVTELLKDKTDNNMLTELLSDEDADLSVINKQLHVTGALPPGVDAYLVVKLGKRKSIKIKNKWSK